MLLLAVFLLGCYFDPHIHEWEGFLTPVGVGRAFQWRVLHSVRGIEVVAVVS